jgi:putative N-acetylmannosamine-6-phosphate epimerase
MQQGYAGRAVGIVFDCRNLGRNAGLVPLEVNDTIVPAMAAAAMTAGDVPVRVAAPCLAKGL